MNPKTARLQIIIIINNKSTKVKVFFVDLYKYIKLYCDITISLLAQ